MRSKQKTCVQATPHLILRYFFRRTEELKERKNFVFENCQFTEITQIGCALENCTFINCAFSACLFHRCDFRSCTFDNCTFLGCNFYTSLMTDCTLRRARMSATVEVNECVIFNNRFFWLDYRAPVGAHNVIHSNGFYETQRLPKGVDRRFWRRNKKWTV